jgi:hypothetical protein
MPGAKMRKLLKLETLEQWEAATAEELLSASMAAVLFKWPANDECKVKIVPDFISVDRATFKEQMKAFLGFSEPQEGKIKAKRTFAAMAVAKSSVQEAGSKGKRAHGAAKEIANSLIERMGAEEAVEFLIEQVLEQESDGWSCESDGEEDLEPRRKKQKTGDAKDDSELA